MKEIKVFIAGSTSLKNEFNAITDALRIITNSNSKGIRITPKTYEDYKDPFSLEGDQAKYNRFIMHKADYVIFVLDGEIGGVTLQEFDVAWNTFASKKRPGIYVYHKPTNTTSKGIQDVIGRINQCEQYYTEYSDIENLKLKVESAFRRIIDVYVTPSTTLWIALAVTILLSIGVGVFVHKNKSTDRPAVVTTTADTQRQDSIEKALQAEADRLAQERKRLEKQAQQIEEKNKQTVAKQTSKPATSAKPATSSKPTVSNPTKVSTNTTSMETAPKASPFVQAKEKADNGDAASCYKVAMAYMNGSDVYKDLAAAFRYMKSAADKGYTAAYIEVAKMYHGGRGVAKNRSTAEFWYKKAAAAGNAEARRILLNM